MLIGKDSGCHYAEPCELRLRAYYTQFSLVKCTLPLVSCQTRRLSDGMLLLKTGQITELPLNRQHFYDWNSVEVACWRYFT